MALERDPKALFRPSPNITYTATVFDSDGNLYVVGNATADAIPTTSGVSQERMAGKKCTAYDKPTEVCADVFIAKISADGKKLLWCTYLGGAGDDQVLSATVVPNGDLVIGGSTNSADLPFTVGAPFGAEGYAFNYYEGMLARINRGSGHVVALAYLLPGAVSAVASDSRGEVIAGHGGGVGSSLVVGFTRLDGTLRTLDRVSTPSSVWAVAVDHNDNVYVASTGPCVEKYDSATPPRQLYSYNCGSPFPRNHVKALAVDRHGQAYMSVYQSVPESLRENAHSGYLYRLSTDGTRANFVTVVPSEDRVWRTTGNPGVRLTEKGQVAVYGSSDSYWRNRAPCLSEKRGKFYGFFQPETQATISFAHFEQVVTVDSAGRPWVPSDQSEELLRPVDLPQFPYLHCAVSAVPDAFRSWIVAPGELISLYGNLIGPDSPAVGFTDDSGFQSIHLDGVSVYIDGVAAPLLFARSDQINAVVPFEMIGRTSASVVIVKNGAVLPAMHVRLAATTARVVSVLNSDGTANSPDNSAKSGSRLRIVLTGLTPQPVPATGSVGRGTTTLPGLMAWFHSAESGRVDTDVLYAGDVPGVVQGLQQIDVRVVQRNGTFTLAVWNGSSTFLSVPVHISQ